MKKFLKGAAVLAAMVLALAFVGCADDDEGDGNKVADFTTTTDVVSLDDLVGTWSAILKDAEEDRGEDEVTIDEKTYKYNETNKLTGEMLFVISKDDANNDALNLEHKVVKGFVMITEYIITDPENITDDDVAAITEELGDESNVVRNGNKFTVTETVTDTFTVESAVIKMIDNQCFVCDNSDRKIFLVKLNAAKDGIAVYDVDDDEIAETPSYQATKK